MTKQKWQKLEEKEATFLIYCSDIYRFFSWKSYEKHIRKIKKNSKIKGRRITACICCRLSLSNIRCDSDSLLSLSWSYLLSSSHYSITLSSNSIFLSLSSLLSLHKYTEEETIIRYSLLLLCFSFFSRLNNEESI